MIDFSNFSVDQLYTELQKRILTAVYKSGEKLSENKLAKEFCVSRMPVREALKRLEQDGLLTILPQSGTYVRQYTLDEVKDALEIRAFLEALAIRLVIENKTDIAPIETCLKKMESCFSASSYDQIAFGKSHFDFHRTLVLLAGNPLLLETYDKLRFRSLRQVFFDPMSQDELNITHSEHKKIIDLIRAQDPQKAERFITGHLWKRKRKNLIYLISKTKH